MNAEALQVQLLRYAQDLEELMQQHHRLQDQHHMLLKSIGRESQSHDMLPALLLESVPLVVVTDTRGIVLRVSDGVASRIENHTGELAGRAWDACVLINQQDAVQTLLRKFSGGTLDTGGVLLQLRLIHGVDQHDAGIFDALVLKTKRGRRFEICWFLQAGTGQVRAPWQVQQDLLATVESDKGLLMTDPFGTIQYANAAFAKITAYPVAELVGQNPRMLSSGRHDAAFFHAMWLELLDSGCWSGTLFNRRKWGQIFLEWQSIKLIENLQGDVLSYISAVADLSYDESVNRPHRQPGHYDTLTGLPSRMQMVDALTQALVLARKAQEQVAVLFIDLDRFKPVNETFGRAVGDAVLQEAATRLKAGLAQGDMLARVGADEFVAVLSGTARVQQAQEVGLALSAALAEPMDVHPQEIRIGASIGCACYPRDGNDMITLVRHADAAMYGAKRRQQRFSYYSAARDLHAQPRLETDIWKAIEQDQLRLLYQPQLRSAGLGAIRGCEALVRWQHPLLGAVPADTFIPIAEENGAIVQIGNWVLEQACAQLRLWREAGVLDLSMSVNISVRQIRDPGFEAHVHQVLTQNGLPPEMLELELSETETLQFRDSDTQHIALLGSLGVRISIDDFGSSFSSLSRLNALSIRSLKINSQFVQNLAGSADARVISNCMLAIGKVLGIEVIAQGVENADQARILAGQGCKVMQGYYAGRPMPAHDLLVLARKRNALPDASRLTPSLSD